MKAFKFVFGLFIAALLLNAAALANSFFFPAGIKGGGTGGGGGLPTFTYEPETITIANAMNTAGANPSAPQEFAINTFVLRLKAGTNIWSKLTGLGSMNYTTTAQAKINWIDGTSITEVGTPTFTSLAGYSTSGTANYLDTGISVTSLSQNNFIFGITSETSGDSNSTDAGAINGSNVGITLQCKTNGAAASFRSMTSAASQGSGSAGDWSGYGLCAVARQNSTTFESYHFGRHVASVSATSAAPTGGGNLFLLKANGGSTASIRTISGWFCGQYLTPAEVAILHAAMRTYQDCAHWGFDNFHEAGFAPTVVTADVIIYGATSQGCVAAYEAQRQGHTVALVGGWREHSIGGMSTSGIGNVDQTQYQYMGALPARIINFARVTVGGQTITGPTAKPLVLCRDFLQSFRQLLDGTRSGGQSVPIYWSKGIASVAKTGTRITSLTTQDGRTFIGTYFIDCSYEGDLMAGAGCSFITGCEPASGVTGSFELLNGWRGFLTTDDHTTDQFPVSIDPYIIPGNPASGYWPGIITNTQTTGNATAYFQSFNFRPHWNTSVANYVPFDSTTPANYDAGEYEPLLRWFAIQPTTALTDVLIGYSLYDSIQEMNSFGPWSSDCYDSGRRYAAALTNADRETEWQRVKDYDLGLFWTLRFSSDSRVPSGIKSTMQTYGNDALTYIDPVGTDPLYFPPQLYIRADRRLVSTYIINGDDFNPNTGFFPTGSTPRSTNTITCSSYSIDSHISIALDESGKITNSGGYFNTDPIGGGVVTSKIRTPLPYEAFLPNSTECTNLGVAFCASATNVGYSATRMECSAMMAAQSLAVACAQAMDNGNQDLQSVNYAGLRTRILADPESPTAVLPQTN